MVKRLLLQDLGTGIWGTAHPDFEWVSRAVSMHKGIAFVNQANNSDVCGRICVSGMIRGQTLGDQDSSTNNSDQRERADFEVEAACLAKSGAIRNSAATFAVSDRFLISA